MTDAMKKRILLIGCLLSLISGLSAKPYILTLDFNRQAANDIAPVQMDTRVGFPITDMTDFNSEVRFLGFTDGKKLYEVGDEPKFKKDTTLTAVWEEPVVTYNLGYDGAPAIDSETFTYGDTLILPEPPARDGYTFIRWVDEDKYEYIEAGEELQLFDEGMETGREEGEGLVRNTFQSHFFLQFLLILKNRIRGQGKGRLGRIEEINQEDISSQMSYGIER